MPVIRRNQVPANLWQSIKPNQSVRHFESAVIQFHNLHKTPIRQLPYVLGKKINLRKLYISVIKRGGYKKVNEKELWEDVLNEINLPKEATNSEFAIQTIYHRYLEDYERNQWNSLNSASFNDNADNTQLDIDFSKHSTFISDLTLRDRSYLASFVYDNTPKIYSDYRHILSHTTREESGLSCDLKEATELKHLILSLKSGMCNEIDFALNTILIMSNNDRISLDLRFTGELLNLLMSVSGIVDIRLGSYYEQFKNYQWMKDCLKFWNNIVEDEVGRMFLVPNIFTCSKTDLKQIQRNCNITTGNLSSELFNDDHQYHKILDPCCQRVHLVATIIHNLAISSLSNSLTLVNSNQTLRFILLSVHCRDPILRRLSLQTLTKLRFVLYPIQDSPDTTLKALLFNPTLSVDIDNCIDKEEDSEQEWFTEFLLDFLMSLLSSENRCDRISAYEMIQSLCLIEDNHETLSRHLQNQFIVRISAQLLVPDIHPLCCALEALVALSQLGDDMCRRMAMCQSLLKCLLQFVNIEAQMFGPTAVYKIKTFNCRPPIPAVNYNHSLRLPPQQSPQTSLRALVPYPQQNASFIPPSNHNSIRSPSVNSISANSLSRPPQLQSPIILNAPPSQYINNNNNVPSNKSQLTPFQQIDHLLTKTIASFSTPTPQPTSQPISPPTPSVTQIIKDPVENFSPKIDKEEQNDVEVSYVKIENPEDRSMKEKHERRIVKIKCCVEGVDLEIEDINGANRHNNKTLVNGTAQEIITGVNKDDEEKPLDTKTELDKLIDNEDSPPDDKEHIYLNHNGSLELEVFSDEDPDRRQMPPPSLPTPSMLKKQMRPKSIGQALSPNAATITNGFFPQQHQHQSSQQQQQLSSEERCEQVKSWLKNNFQITCDAKLFVPKSQLVEELHDALCDLDEHLDLSESGQKMALSAQELHNCIKEIFGPKVQVKVEHGINGSTQLIYSHLGRIESDENCKHALTNGVVMPEMNGFVNHSTKRKASSQSDSDEDKIEEKKVCEDNGKETQEKDTLTQTHTIPVIKKKVNRGRKKRSFLVANKVKQRYKLSRDKTQKAPKLHTPPLSHKPVIIPSNGPNINNINTTLPYDELISKSPGIIDPGLIQGQYLCLWNGNCQRRFIDECSLESHVTNDHLDSIISSTSLSPTRAHCQWRDCPTSQIPRAPLSLLSHVIQEHCTALSTNPRPNYNVIPVMPSVTTSPSPALNTMVSSNMKTNNYGPNNQLLEKSGWSVLYDHYRLDEQLHNNLPEGPITKHIRISSSIILRNMSRHSIIAKEFLRCNEKYLSQIAMNNQDCSSVIAQCLDELCHQTSAVDDTNQVTTATTTTTTVTDS